MKDNFIEFKERLEDDEDFKNVFISATNLDEVVDLARENGYDLDVEEITDDAELSDYLLEAVAGGEDDTFTHKLEGNNNIVFTANNKEEAQKYAQKMVEELHKRGIYGTH